MLTASWTYVRFHGPRAATHPYRGRYGARRLQPWAERPDIAALLLVQRTVDLLSSTTTTTATP